MESGESARVMMCFCHDNYYRTKSLMLRIPLSGFAKV